MDVLANAHAVFVDRMWKTRMALTKILFNSACSIRDGSQSLYSGYCLHRVLAVKRTTLSLRSINLNWAKAFEQTFGSARQRSTVVRTYGTRIELNTIEALYGGLRYSFCTNAYILLWFKNDIYVDYWKKNRTITLCSASTFEYSSHVHNWMNDKRVCPREKILSIAIEMPFPTVYYLCISTFPHV